MTKQKRINHEIIADIVFVISDTGEQLGKLPLREAIKQAEKKNLDIVEIGERDGIVMTKMMDWGKFTFKQQKNISKSRAAGKKADQKTLRISYKIGDHDLDVKRKQAQKFATAGNPIKVELILRGRERQFEAVGKEKMLAFVQSLEEFYKRDGDIKVLGNKIHFALLPKK